MGRDPEILHEEVCRRLDKIIGLLERMDMKSNPQFNIAPFCAPVTFTNLCQCVGLRTMNSSGICINCGLPVASSSSSDFKQKCQCSRGSVTGGFCSVCGLPK